MNAVTFTEREAIRKMLEYIDKERERLYNQSLSLLDRLRDLDNIEKPEQPEKPEAKEVAELVSTGIAYIKPGQIEPDYSQVEPCNLLAGAGKQVAENIFKKYYATVPPEEKKELIPKTEIEAQKDKDAKRKPVKPSSQRDVKMIAQYVKAILKEAGVPIRTAELIKRLDEVGINTSSPYVLLAQVSQYDPRIEKPKFGFYQYNFSA